MPIRVLALVLIACLLPSCVTASASRTAGALRVSADGRHLVEADGRPFLWLADTAWELFHRLDAAEARHYLDDRRAKGFNVVQAVILAELGGLRVPNANGDLPLDGGDPLRPNEDYFRHVDAVVAMAEARGITMALLPTWGDKFNRKWGEGPEIFTPDNARAFGGFLGRRYAGRRVVWLLGGDRNPETPLHLEIIRAMAGGIDAATGGRQLMTYHPQGGSSSAEFFAADPWIDFHLFQSGHDHRDLDNDRWTVAGRLVKPVRPVIDGEPRYEDHPIGLFRLGDKWVDEPGSWFGAFDVRQAAWWSMLAGAAGHTYGNHNIWQMWQPGREPVSRARTHWRTALDQAGAAQMGIMRRFLERHGFGTLEPAQELLAAAGEGAARQRAARTGDGRTVLVYSPVGAAVRLNRGTWSGTMRPKWFDPRSGKSLRLEDRDAGALMFDPPGEPARGNDWVLVLERHGSP